MNQAVIIRDVTESDAAQWLSLRRALWPGDDEAHASEVKSFFAGALDEPEAVLVATVGSMMVGIAELSIRLDIPGLEGKEVGYVEGLDVIPSYRGTGVARRLLESCRAWARQKSCLGFASDRAARIIIDPHFQGQ